jgi:hypothetical protein
MKADQKPTRHDWQGPVAAKGGDNTSERFNSDSVLQQLAAVIEPHLSGPATEGNEPIPLTTRASPTMLPPPGAQNVMQTWGGVLRPVQHDVVNLREVLRAAPNLPAQSPADSDDATMVVLPDEDVVEDPEPSPPTNNSLAPVSLAMEKLLDDREAHARRKHVRAAYTAVVGTALVAALFAYRAQPSRTGARMAEPRAAAGQGVLGGANLVLQQDLSRAGPAARAKSVSPAPLTTLVEDWSGETVKGQALTKGIGKGKMASLSKAVNPATATDAKPRESQHPAAGASPTATASAVMEAEEARSVPAESSVLATAAIESAQPGPVIEEPFNRERAQEALQTASARAGACRGEGDPGATVRVSVTFAPSGSVTTAWVDGPPYSGTSVGGCIAKVFRTASIAPFGGGLVTVHKTFQIH